MRLQHEAQSLLFNGLRVELGDAAPSRLWVGPHKGRVCARLLAADPWGEDSALISKWFAQGANGLDRPQQCIGGQQATRDR